MDCKTPQGAIRPGTTKLVSTSFALGLLLALLQAPASAVPLAYNSGTLDFSTTDQSMWGSGAATVLRDSNFYGAQWANKSTTLGGIIGSKTSKTIYTNPLWWVWKACKETFNVLCGSEPSKGKEKVTVDTRTGAELTLKSSGKFGVEVGYELNAGSINAEVQFQADAELPRSAIGAGDPIMLNTGSTLTDGMLETQSPTAKAYLNAIAQLSAEVSAQGCLIALGCKTGSSGKFIDINGDIPLLAVNPNAIEVLPEALPPDNPGGDRKPLLTTNLFNQELTLQASLDAAGVPGFKVATNFGTLVDTTPTGVPSIELDLASLEFQVPEIQATGGVVGDIIKAGGRDDFLSLKADLDGLATLSGTVPPLGLGVSLIDIGAGPTNFKVGASLDILDIDAGPDLGFAQDFELKPTLMAKIAFSAPVMIAGLMVNSWEGIWDQLPAVTLFETTTFSPTYWIDVLLDHQLALDLGLSGTLDLFRVGLSASLGTVRLIGGSISLNQLTGIGNTLFQTDRLEFSIYGTEFSLGGFSEVVGAAFTIRVPEPGTVLLMLLGLVLILGPIHRRRRSTTLNY